MWLVTLFETYGTMISTIALTITLGVLIWYAWETRGLRKETVKQTELSQRPFVMVFEAGNHRLKYKNSGLGVALNIRFKDIFQEAYTFTFEEENLLSPNEVSKGDINPIARDNLTGEPYSPNTKIPFTPYELRSANITFIRIVIIQYESIEKKRYQTLVNVSNEGIEYLGTNDSRPSLVSGGYSPLYRS